MKLLITVLYIFFSHLAATAIDIYETPLNSTFHCASTGKEAVKKVRVLSGLNEVHLEKIYHLNQQTPDLLLLEDNNDEENNVKTHIRKYYTFFSDLIFPVQYPFLKERLSSGRYLFCTGSCKYIIQRVLRI